MTWQWVILILGTMAFIVALVYLGNKKSMGDAGLKMMEDNNVILKAFMEANGMGARQ